MAKAAQVPDGRVAVLDERAANQIAAGEVVERPASVVKELCENALDAQARRISVLVHEGGRRLIRLVDDGHGMGPSDAVMALQRHATSKIRSAADVKTIGSLGFRGEALPSIASVSRFELITRRHGDLAATVVRVEGGATPQVGEAGAPPGTQVSVADLFFHTPARLKFLRGASAELHHVVDAVTRLALARPDVAFRLETERGPLLSTPGTGQLRDAALAALGREIAGGLFELEWEQAPLRVTGLLGRPEIARSNRQLQFFAVNTRPVRALALRYALEEAYAGLLHGGRFPVAIVELRIDPAEVDVNVHPTKQEVRFSREGLVRAAIYRAATAVLAGQRLVPGEERRDEAQGFSPWSALRVGEAAAAYFVAPGTTDALAEAPPVTDVALSVPGTFLAELRPIGQVLGTYVLAEGEGGLYLIDQHAAHERIVYDALAERGAGRKEVPSQPLVVPLDVEIGPQLDVWWEEFGPALRECGFAAEPFGGGVLLVRAVPAALESPPVELVRAIFSRLQAGEDGRGALDRAHDVRRAVAACRAAIKANDRLSMPGIAALLQQLAATAHPFTCPHGRPTVICLSQGELERRFKRRA